MSRKEVISGKGLANLFEYNNLERSIVMGLSTIEIAEEDCQTDTFLRTTMINEKHLKTLIGKWCKRENDKDWFVSKGNEFQVGEQVCVRSPIYCVTGDKKICQKCWGTKTFNTNYLGILAGQILSERFTQLTMRSFHDSGSAQLTISKELKKFIKEHLIDIEYEENFVILVFDTTELHEEFKEFSNFQTTAGNKIYFYNTFGDIKNNDPIEALRNVKLILKVAKSNIKQPHEYYDLLMQQILTVGSPYSSFVELLLTNMFLTDDKRNELWRYNQTLPIKCKLGDKTLSGKTSPLLNLLYQQNKKTIQNIEFLNDYLTSNKLTIYEKLFLERF